MRTFLLAGAFALAQAVFAVPYGAQLLPRNTTATDTASSAASACTGNSATSRSTWCDYDLSTNYYDEAPDTGVTREYWLELAEDTVSPDGYSRFAVSL